MNRIARMKFRVLVRKPIFHTINHLTTETKSELPFICVFFIIYYELSTIDIEFITSLKSCRRKSFFWFCDKKMGCERTCDCCFLNRFCSEIGHNNFQSTLGSSSIVFINTRHWKERPGSTTSVSIFTYSKRPYRSEQEMLYRV